ncbi:hypothetical protein VHP8226_01576 [Vibrio hippocampi]|uniref:Transcriptional regulator n=1 Tax=Vibrio hippocampi TaxID=654686 RepID=A0ABN8DHF0_9VIBR|nr:hypothetical protein VHP8226_01576 [Vibrio hippocampi]
MPSDPNYIQIEISADKLASLVKSGHLCAAHIRCLNPDAKQFVWQLCLNNCADKLCGAPSGTNQTNPIKPNTPSPDLLHRQKRII